MTRFTIVTITFNAEAVLQRTLDSVHHQTYPGVEHLIIDGLSTDNTLAIANAYKQANDDDDNCEHRVIVRSEPDEGIYDAMNKGLSQASGDYILFLNAGDFLPANDTLEQITRNCMLNSLPSADLPGVLYGKTDIVDNEGNYLFPRRLQPPEKLTSRSFLKGMVVCHQAFYARCDIAKNLSFDTRYRHSADVDWCIRVMQESERASLPLANSHLTVACYTREGQTTRNRKQSLKERFAIMRDHYGLTLTILMHIWFALRAIVAGKRL